MSYQKSITSHEYGLTLRVENPSQENPARWKRRVTLCDPRQSMAHKSSGELRALAHLQATGSNKIACQKSIEEKKSALFRANKEQLLNWACNGEWTDVPLEFYVSYFRSETGRLCGWLKNEGKYLSHWDNVLSHALGNKTLAELSSPLDFKKEMDIITNRQRKREYTVEEHEYWIVMDDIFRILLKNEIISVNPASEQGKYHRDALTDNALTSLRRSSFSKAETSDFLDWANKDRSTICTALLVAYLTGMSIFELCGLDLGAWKKGNVVSWLEITKEYRQTREKPPQMTYSLDSANQYRRLVCTDVVEAILYRHVSNVMETAPSENRRERPMFEVNGERLTPDTLKAEIKNLKARFVREDGKLPYSQRGFSDSDVMQRTEILRANANYCYREYALLTLPELSFVLGINRRRTYGIWYVDWNNELVLEYLKSKIERWHHMFLNVHPTFESSIIPGYLSGISLSGNATNGSTLQVTCPFGIYGTIRRE